MTSTDFYPRPPRGGRHQPDFIADFYFIFLSTPSARRATIQVTADIYTHLISIHALREEGDRPRFLIITTHRYFYPRPPRGGRRRSCEDIAAEILFLSTPSARRATDATSASTSCWSFLSTPSARRATPCEKAWGFSTKEFLSTPSARRATASTMLSPWQVRISIHALREEGDACSFWLASY